jgi:hypothetical protein
MRLGIVVRQSRRSRGAVNAAQLEDRGHLVRSHAGALLALVAFGAKPGLANDAVTDVMQSAYLPYRCGT